MPRAIGTSVKFRGYGKFAICDKQAIYFSKTPRISTRSLDNLRQTAIKYQPPLSWGLGMKKIPGRTPEARYEGYFLCAKVEQFSHFVWQIFAQGCIECSRIRFVSKILFEFRIYVDRGVYINFVVNP